MVLLDDCRRAARYRLHADGRTRREYYGGDRKGKNLFANSVVAVDANTGKLKWYFQTVHHELWDYDLPPDPVLIDIVKDGKKIPALAQAGKSGYLFILDRVTGKPVFGVEERPVAQRQRTRGIVFADSAFSSEASTIARVSIKREDIVTADDTNADHAKACQDLWVKHGFEDSGPFTPQAFQAEGTRMSRSVFPVRAVLTGAARPAISGELGYVFVNSQDSPGSGWIRKNPGNPTEEANFPTTKRPAISSFAAQSEDADGKSIGPTSLRETAIRALDTARSTPIRASSPGRFHLESPKVCPKANRIPAARALSPDRSQPRAVSFSSAQPVTAASAPSIRKRARNSGRRNSNTPPQPSLLLFRARTGSSTWPSLPPVEAGETTRRLLCSVCRSFSLELVT